MANISSVITRLLWSTVNYSFGCGLCKGNMNFKVLIILTLATLVQMYLANGEEITKTPEEASTIPSIKRSSHLHYEIPKFQGFWKKKFIWRPRWVKTWQEKKIYVAVWKRMWGPAEVKEWVPIPKPPPGWIKSDPGNYFVKVPH